MIASVSYEQGVFSSPILRFLESTSDETETTDILDATVDTLIPESVLEFDAEQQQVEHSAEIAFKQAYPVSCSV